MKKLKSVTTLIYIANLFSAVESTSCFVCQENSLDWNTGMKSFCLTLDENGLNKFNQCELRVGENGETEGRCESFATYDQNGRLVKIFRGCNHDDHHDDPPECMVTKGERKHCNSNCRSSFCNNAQ